VLLTIPGTGIPRTTNSWFHELHFLDQDLSGRSAVCDSRSSGPGFAGPLPTSDKRYFTGGGKFFINLAMPFARFFRFFFC
jgi:hypothetical protein